jgi:two-component system, OmpR family, response regulator
LRRALATRYDLVILDLVMPDLDGRQVLGRLLASRPSQAVIVLSCVADVAAKVDCLERGAQDYLTKPFSLAELLARVRVRLRGEPHAHAEATARTAAGHSAAAENGTAEPGGTGSPQEPYPSTPSMQGAQGSVGDPHPHMEVIRAGDVTLDVGRLVADIGHGPVPLTRLEFLLLRELAEHVGQSVPKGKLLATVWGYDFDPGSNVVDVCVRRLRSKLGFDLIKTVRGEGYQLVAR